MPEDYTVLAAKDGGLVDNPKAPGQLQRQYVTVKAPDGTETSDVYLRRKPENAATVGSIVFGELEKNDQGWRLFPKQKDGAGNFKAPSYQREESKDDYWKRKDERIEWAWACNLAATELAVNRRTPGGAMGGALEHDAVVERAREIREQARKELDADLGGGGSTQEPTGSPTADLSAESSAEEQRPEANPAVQRQSEAGIEPAAEASPAQKGKLTQLFHKAGLNRDAMKAVVMWRCGQEKATRQGASQLITDLQEGATHDQLLAEIWDAKRAGNPLGARAAELIAGLSETPWEDDQSLPPAPAKDESDIPF